MSIADALGKLLSPDSPWLVYLAGVLLVAAAGVGRRLFASLQRLGARIGAQEKAVALEVVRRRQLEEVLRYEGVPLPYWPPDGPPIPQQHEDQADELRTRQAPAIPVPPPDRHTLTRSSR